MLKILYLGINKGTSAHRINALRRIGHEVFDLNPDGLVPGTKWQKKIHQECGSLLYEPKVRRSVLAAIPDQEFDCVWVDQGRNVGPKLVKELGKRYGPVANFNIDNPFGNRDRAFWLLFKKALSQYGLVVVPRRSNLKEAKALGAKRVVFHFRTADEVAHSPRSIPPAESIEWASQVVFVGTAITGEGRAGFIARLLQAGIPVQVVGDNWSRTPEWKRIQPAWKGPNTRNDQEYAAAILSSQVALCLLSARNHDLHTTRSLEIPALGGLFCAPRTSEHLELYEDGEEAVFWDTMEECAEACRRLLGSQKLRTSIAHAGHARCLRNNLYNQPFANFVLGELLGAY